MGGNQFEALAVTQIRRDTVLKRHRSFKRDARSRFYRKRQVNRGQVVGKRQKRARGVQVTLRFLMPMRGVH